MVFQKSSIAGGIWSKNENPVYMVKTGIYIHIYNLEIYMKQFGTISITPYFFMTSRIKHQNNQLEPELPPGLLFGVQLGLRPIKALINTKKNKKNEG